MSPQLRGAGALGLAMNEDKGFFGNLFDAAMLKVVETKEKDSTRKRLQPCVFCDQGKLKCAACNGSGKDAIGGGKCFLCEGKGADICSVCAGIGMVDRIRRGGTDTKGEWAGSQKVMDPLSPQLEPYILELDGGEKYAWCQCGVSTKQPFCDTVSHRAYGLKPVGFKAEGDAGTKVKATLCGCKYTNTPPYCDGTHVGMKAAADAEQAV
eukprot:CAMPEP_0184294690 /NCGR_PEP_ID=MMETSP1049-20130417/5815_1 /TAXON_ID=77928 /ORGANISM="Proteomonas sulcata, Strain CCMP704" /LENGTH=208 /DNA_ID=CAMNT_0026603055 /DNA_START=157 /DNA_END=783 /DNA_ORIENTATION=-